MVDWTSVKRSQDVKKRRTRPDSNAESCFNKSYVNGLKSKTFNFLPTPSLGLSLFTPATFFYSLLSLFRDYIDVLHSLGSSRRLHRKQVWVQQKRMWQQQPLSLQFLHYSSQSDNSRSRFLERRRVTDDARTLSLGRGRD